MERMETLRARSELLAFFLVIFFEAGLSQLDIVIIPEMISLTMKVILFVRKLIFTGISYEW